MSHCYELDLIKASSKPSSAIHTMLPILFDRVQLNKII